MSESTMADPLSTQPAEPPPLGARGFLRWVWRQFTSMRVALILLVILAIVSIPGSLLPQKGVNPEGVAAWVADHGWWGSLLKALGFFDVYASPWFAAVYLMLFTSLIGCILPRTFHHIKALRAQPPRAPRNLMRLESPQEVASERTAGEALDASAEHLKSTRWRVRRGEDDSGAWVAAEKGYWRETGNIVFHIALILLLIGVAVGSLWTWKGAVLVVSGKGFSNTVTQYDTFEHGRFASTDDLPPFSFRLDSFDFDFERTGPQTGSPLYFNASLTVKDAPGAQPYSASVGVNSPITIEGARLYLVNPGYAPHIIIKDSTGRVVFDDFVPCIPQQKLNYLSDCVIKVPDATPQMGFPMQFAPTTLFIEGQQPTSIFPGPDDPGIYMSMWVGDLGLDDGVPQNVYKLDTAKMTLLERERLRPGQTWQLPDGRGTLEFAGYTTWARFTVTHDPGQGVVLAAVILAILGLLLSLFVRRRRVWVRATPSGTGSTVVAAGLTRGDDDRLAGLVGDLVDAATERKGA